jgi:hypothetical protein
MLWQGHWPLGRLAGILRRQVESIVPRPHASKSRAGWCDAGGFSIFPQDVNFAKFILKPFYTFDAMWASLSVTLGRHDRPAVIARYDCNRD